LVFEYNSTTIKKRRISNKRDKRKKQREIKDKEKKPYKQKEKEIKKKKREKIILFSYITKTNLKIFCVTLILKFYY